VQTNYSAPEAHNSSLTCDTPNTPAVKPCRVCGATDRNPSGACRACVSKTALKWHRDHPERMREIKAQFRSRQAERPTPCRKCGSIDRFPSGGCRACCKAVALLPALQP
jgi:hypothetical protein